MAHGPEIAPREAQAERTDYAQVLLEQRERDALERLNPDLPADARDEALRKLLRVGGATVETLTFPCR